MRQVATVVTLAIVCALWRTGDTRGVELPPDSVFTPPTIVQPQFPDRSWNVKDFGATGDGRTNDTAAVSKAIETASTSGGGTVHFPAGKYMLASARIRSNVRLMLDNDAVIEGLRYGYDAPEPNPQFDKYQDFGHSHFRNSVLWGENIENFAIVGGKVNGGGATQGDQRRPATQPDGSQAWGGDKVIAIKVGKNLLFKDVTHDTGAHFVYLLNDCENITVNKVVIKKSRDAIDLMGCRNVAVSECRFTGCSDDTIGVKSDYALGRKINTENIYVWDCYFESGCNGLQFGSETAGDFRNVFFWNITINLGMKSGIGITSNDGGIIENVHYKNIKIRNAAVPIFMLITDRLRTGEPGARTGKIRNVTIQNVEVSEVVAGRHHGPANCATISGRPESSIENILLHNVKITYKGNDEKPEEADRVPELPKGYSPNQMGKRPASGLFMRHAKGITLRNVEIGFENPHVKPPLVVWDVDGLTLDSVNVPKAAGLDTIRAQRVTGLKAIDSPAIEEAAAALMTRAAPPLREASK